VDDLIGLIFTKLYDRNYSMNELNWGCWIVKRLIDCRNR